MSKRILILTDDLKYSCGISSYLYNFLSENKSTEFEFYILCSGGDAVERFKKITPNVFIDSIYREVKKNYLNFLVAIFKLLVFSWRHEINIVHAQNYYVANIARFVSYINRIKTIQTHHNFFKKTKKLKLMACQYQIVVNDNIKEYLLKSYPLYPKSNVHLIHYGIMLNDVLSTKSNPKIKVIAAGRLIKEKDFITYLNAIKLLPDRIFEIADFYLAGEGVELDFLLKKIEQEKIRVIYLGNLKPLINFLVNSDIFVFTSNWDSEGFPMSILEAATTKNLIITSNFNGLNIHFIDEVHGLVYKSTDFLALASKINFAIENLDKLNKNIIMFQRYTQENFSLSYSVQKVLDLYKTV